MAWWSHRAHVVQEIINSRLFVTVRDQLNLTYDVSFEIVQHDRLNASWWCATVTASPPKIADATQASLQVRVPRSCCCAAPCNADRVWMGCAHGSGPQPLYIRVFFYSV